MRSGRVRSVKDGGMRFVTLDALHDYVRQLEDQAIGILRPCFLQRPLGQGPVCPDGPGDEDGSLIGAVACHA